jgi:hypothetical protein
LIERRQFEEMLSRHPVHNHELDDEVGDAVLFIEAG